MIRVLAIDGSPRGGGKTATALQAVLAGAAAAGASTTLVSLADDREGKDGMGPMAGALTQLAEHDAFVFGAPAYRAAAAAPLKAFLDLVPRGFWGEKEKPITGRAVGLVMTGSTFHHYLALDGVRSILTGFFACHVLSPGLYLASDSFENAALTSKSELAAAAQGRAVVALAQAISASPELQAVRPQA